MTQILSLSRPIPRGWLDLAHVLAGAPARRRREFALTEPTIFRSECFAEDLPAPAETPARRAVAGSGRTAALLCALPVSAALLGATVVLFERFA